MCSVLTVSKYVAEKLLAAVGTIVGKTVRSVGRTRQVSGMYLFLAMGGRAKERVN